MNPWMIAIPSAVAAGIAGLTAYGAVHPRSQLFGHTVCNTPSPKLLALTFDDGPNHAVTPKLLDLLAKYNAKATFFLVGKFVNQCSALAKETAARGHLLGNHTQTHPNLFFCGPNETREELQRCTEAVHNATWEQPRWFRPPYGFRSPWLGEITQNLSLATAMWSLMPGDWRVKPHEWLIDRMKPIAAHAQQNLRETNASSATSAPPAGDIICLHDGSHAALNGDRTATLAALAYWLPRWRDLGLQFVTMNEIMRKAVEA
jgi:peptidoglycan/xylan/chitin deacetylase (PgdA/CDA1 family)